MLFWLFVSGVFSLQWYMILVFMERNVLLYEHPAQFLPQKNLSGMALTPVFALQTNTTYLLQVVIMNNVNFFLIGRLVFAGIVERNYRLSEEFQSFRLKRIPMLLYLIMNGWTVIFLMSLWHSHLCWSKKLVCTF
jgi:hypothetical protein